MTQLEIEAFLAVVKLGSISAAAQKLYITQPALSRRISALEKEADCVLFKRRKGMRGVELTEEGKNFITLAERWRGIYREMKLIKQAGRIKSLRIASVGSVGQYILPGAFTKFMQQYPGCSLVYSQHHSLECYEYVERGEFDLAIISDDMYSRTVDTVPLFCEKMQLVTQMLFDSKYISPLKLNPANEIRLPWNPEYDAWHDYYFSAGSRPHVFLDQMALMEYFLEHPFTWVIAPGSIAAVLGKKSHLNVYNLEDGPSDMTIYYLKPLSGMSEYAEKFLAIFKSDLKNNSSVAVY